MDCKKLKNIVGILVGNALYALAVILFVIPKGLITGESTGLAIASFHVYFRIFCFRKNICMNNSY